MSEWTDNQEAESRVKDLLERAGIPHEIRAAKLCQEFSAACNSESLHVSSDRIVYSPSEEAYREIDQRVQIYEEFELSELTGIQLIVNLPIECKYRRDIAGFGFSSLSPADVVNKGFPICSLLAGSNLYRSLFKSYKQLSTLRPFNISMVEIKKGSEPKKVHDENIIYNATASLYDYILFDTTVRLLFK